MNPNDFNPSVEMPKTTPKEVGRIAECVNVGNQNPFL